METVEGMEMGCSEQTVDVVVLGSGTSHGVPMIGCTCHVCTSPNPRDHRTRCSILIATRGKQLLVDTSPELRLQCVANNVSTIDAILYTHQHADHVVGLDDVRRFNWLTKRSIPCYGTPRVLESIRRMFSYAFDPEPDSPHSRPALELMAISEEPFEVDGVAITPIPLIHGRTQVMGFRVGDFAYCTDCNEIPEDSFRRLQGVKVLMLDALRRTPHPAHFNLEQAMEMATRIGATKTYFTHIAHELLHEETERELPDGMHLAYDGLRLTVPGKVATGT